MLYVTFSKRSVVVGIVAEAGAKKELLHNKKNLELLLTGKTYLVENLTIKDPIYFVLIFNQMEKSDRSNKYAVCISFMLLYFLKEARLSSAQ